MPADVKGFAKTLAIAAGVLVVLGVIILASVKEPGGETPPGARWSTPAPPKFAPTSPVPDAEQRQVVKDMTELYQQLQKQRLITKVTTGPVDRVWVDPSVFNLMTYDQKQQIAYTCIVALHQETQPEGVTLEIIDKMNGHRLARWGQLTGFKVD